MDIGRRSRGAYSAQCTLAYFSSLLIEDAFLAKLLHHMGMSDALTGIVSSLITLSFLAELLFFPLIHRIREIKRAVILFDALSMLCYAAAFTLPVWPVPVTARHVMVIVLIIGGHLSTSCIKSIYYVWANSFVAPERRARFSALKEMISLGTGILFSLGMGFLFDTLEGEGNNTQAFLAAAGIILMINVLSVLCLVNIGKVPKDEKQPQNTLIVMKKVIKNRSFMNVVLMSAGWYAAKYFTSGFMGIYKTGELMMSVTLIQIINMLGSAARITFSLPFGRYSDRTSYTRGFRLSMVLAAIAYAAIVFTVRTTWWLTAVYSILMAVSLAGNNANLMNIAYSYVDKDLLVPAMALKNGICGIVGLLFSFMGGLLLDAVQKAGDSFLGIPVKGQQLLALISFLIVLFVIAFCCRVVEKQPIRKQ